MNLLKPLRKLSDPTPIWRKCHVSRRSAVLALLIGDGPDFQTLLTIRSANLSYGGDAAFPGGKAETEQESIWDVALREAHEEINLDQNTITPVGLMPGYLSSNHLLVIPAVGWVPSIFDLKVSDWQPPFREEEEVHKIFTPSLSTFLPDTTADLNEFNILATKRLPGDSMYDRVWGLTAHILIDLARLVFQDEPKFRFYRGNYLMAAKGTQIGSTKVIDRLLEKGFLQSPRIRRSG